MTTTTTANILSPGAYERRAAKWATILSKIKSDALQQSFLVATPAGQERLAYVSFPIQHIVWLMSTVGVRHIQARFLIATKKVDGQRHPYFTLALYATDALGARVSAFYLPSTYAGEPKPSELPTEQAPHDLVKAWLNNWATAPEITSALFANSYGPLLGYSFSVEDFMRPLFEAQPFTNQELRVGFGLHEYYPALPVGAERAYTFGLVLRLYTPPTEESAAAISSAPFFDLSTPCPPGT
ncbi:hypothetical protein [Hymenobacter cellulosivorans]|uniref:Uncharacterized protein n=1 Tax=Hymenobacter cellulosivorans TaxID=2932249 RepID=A0ABY4F8G7_9BACT|nr:hypothetical protein [Hymenobacter cellulosivorans]UOQ50756.1 hypothetical protein MUN80_13405 [Hymenobacter cellulosivorans]